MEWIKLVIKTMREDMEHLTGRLLQLGISGVEINDPDEFQSFVNSGDWDYIDDQLSVGDDYTVTVYVTNNDHGLAMIDNINEPIISRTIISEEDWANNWKAYFKPFEIGEKILIKPEWEQLEQPTTRTILTINPGMSFGTGDHASTKLCIEQLEKYVAPGMQVLDLGTGSGILSVASVLLGAEHVTALDIDPNCIKIVYDNAALNNIESSRITALCQDALTHTPDGQFDVIVSNIVADVIIGLSPIIPKCLKKGGVYIASGIIDQRAEEVKNALPFGKINQIEQDGWICLVATDE